MQGVLELSAVLLIAFLIGCSPTEPSGADEETPGIDASSRIPLQTVDVADLPGDYVQVPGFNIAVKCDDYWRNNFQTVSEGRRAGQVWSRRYLDRPVAGAIVFIRAPRIAASAEALAKAMQQEAITAPEFVKEGDHDRFVTVGDRVGYVTSYHSQVDGKKLYNLNVVVVLDDGSFLLATCGYETRHDKDLSDELLTKMKEVKFLAIAN